jgi:prepilin-type N-terminal cleavage/methylation domain-containing protein
MKKKTSVLNRRDGFTLAELLIVVAIIAVLVAIAIPIFNNRLEAARETVDVELLTNAYNAGVRCINAGALDDGVKVEAGKYAYYNPQNGEVVSPSTYNSNKAPFKTKVSAKIDGWQGRVPDASKWGNGGPFYNNSSPFAWPEYQGAVQNNSYAYFDVTDNDSVVVGIYYDSNPYDGGSPRCYMAFFCGYR